MQYQYIRKEELKNKISKDYLGSVQSLSEVNSQGNVVVVAEFSYDAWGRARSHTDWDENFQSDASVPGFALLERGFTGHEHIIQFGIINMNARLYDPVLASFLSPDDVVSDPENPQNYNRFSYALNNPMRYTDPSGNNPFLIAIAIGAFMGGASYAITTPNATWDGLLKSMALGGIAGAVSYGVGSGLNALLGEAAPGSFASLLYGIRNSLANSFITNMAFEGKYTGSSALQSVAFSFVNWGIDAMSSSSMNEGAIGSDIGTAPYGPDANKIIYQGIFNEMPEDIKVRLKGITEKLAKEIIYIENASNIHSYAEPKITVYTNLDKSLWGIKVESYEKIGYLDAYNKSGFSYAPNSPVTTDVELSYNLELINNKTLCIDYLSAHGHPDLVLFRMGGRLIAATNSDYKFLTKNRMTEGIDVPLGPIPSNIDVKFATEVGFVFYHGATFGTFQVHAYDKQGAYFIDFKTRRR